jgi:hypothetical protein
LSVVTVAAVAHSRSAQLSTAVTFRFGPASSIESAARRTAAARLAKRLECSSAVSSRLSDTAHSQAEETDRQNYRLKIGKCLFTIDISFIDISVNHINQEKFCKQ